MTVTHRKTMGLASYLGSTALTLLIRCPCGRRNYFDRRAWQWFEVAFCVRCWQAIRYHDLRVISRWEGERMLREQTVYEGELKALRTVEGVMHRFLSEFQEQPLWMWPPQIVRMAQAVKANLRLAELARARQGAEPAVPFEELPEGIFLEMPGEEAYELTPEQTRLLSIFSRLPEERRADMLAFFEEGIGYSAGDAEGQDV
ncbi:MAG TPA: hypothetical protein VEY11_19695 [Pyrinomonadaceae bacterium]|nr:hypothetical protein [Pyrinomonadaceae bacterium]